MGAARVAMAQIWHETNRFSAIPTDLAAFAALEFALGEAGPALFRGTNSPVGGFLDAAPDAGLQILPLLVAGATPGGIVTAATLDYLHGELLRRLRAARPVDGVLLALHGAMVAEGLDDPEGALLGAIRALVGARVPIVATLDMHANITREMVAAADVLVGYDTYPHVDMAERGREAATLLGRLLRREVRPTAALRRPPMVPTSQRMATQLEPMRGILARAHEIERDPRILNCTIAGGFPLADVPFAGFGVIVTADDDPALAAHYADDLARFAWERRAGFLGGVATLDEARAAIGATRAGRGDRPLVLVDIADNPLSGGPGDSAWLLGLLLAEGARGAALATIADPVAVATACAAGEGATLTLAVGGRTDRLHGEPLTITGTVGPITDGRFVNEGPMQAGVTVELGRTLRLDCDGVSVILTERRHTPIDRNLFRLVGLEPGALRLIALKGKGHFRAAFEPLASAVVLVEGPGITGADLSRLPFRKLRRPIWPLDDMGALPGAKREPPI